MIYVLSVLTYNVLFFVCEWRRFCPLLVHVVQIIVMLMMFVLLLSRRCSVAPSKNHPSITRSQPLMKKRSSLYRWVTLFSHREFFRYNRPNSNDWIDWLIDRFLIVPKNFSKEACLFFTTLRRCSSFSIFVSTVFQGCRISHALDPLSFESRRL